MKFKISTDGEYESESDYDTAIDLVTTTTNNTEYTLQTISGAKLIISLYETRKSTSYLEPDFNDEKAIERAEQTGQPMPYVLHVSEKDDVKTSVHARYIIDEKIISLTKEEFKDYFTNYLPKSQQDKEDFDLIDNGKFSTFEKQHSNKFVKLNDDEYRTYSRVYEFASEKEQKQYDNANGSKFADFFAQELRNKFSGQSVSFVNQDFKNLDKNTLLKFISYIDLATQDETFSCNKYTEVTVPEEILHNIHIMEQEQNKIKTFNNSQLLNSMVDFARNKIEIGINEMAKDALTAIKSRKSNI